MPNSMHNVSAVRRRSGLALKGSTPAGADIVAATVYMAGLQGGEATNPDVTSCVDVTFDVIVALGNVNVGHGASRFEAQGDAIN